MDTATFGKIVIGIGVTIAVLGGAIWLLGKTGVPLGHLPGDIRVEGQKSSFYFPVVTCILLSVVLTVLINLALRLFR